MNFSVYDIDYFTPVVLVMVKGFQNNFLLNVKKQLDIRLVRHNARILA